MLPGESLSRHRGSRTGQVSIPAETADEVGSADEIEEQAFVEEMASDEFEPEQAMEPGDDVASIGTLAAFPDDEIVEETYEADSSRYEPHAVLGEPATESALGQSVEPDLGTTSEPEVGFSSDPEGSERRDKESAELEGNRSASHNVDPLLSVVFCLFGFGG